MFFSEHSVDFEGDPRPDLAGRVSSTARCYSAVISRLN